MVSGRGSAVYTGVWVRVGLVYVPEVGGVWVPGGGGHLLLGTGFGLSRAGWLS